MARFVSEGFLNDLPFAVKPVAMRVIASLATRR